MAEKGKFIVLYGANNLGKSLQLEMLETALKDKGLVTSRLKYPIYDLEPTGPKINAVLRQGVQMPEVELQQLYAQNRRDYEPELRLHLTNGTWIIAEDYSGTGVAWGMIRGLSLEELEQMNKGLLVEDVAMLIYGERFKTGVESTHRNENDDDLWRKAQENHLMLAERYGWEKIYANRTPEEVHQNIMEVLNLKGVL